MIETKQGWRSLPGGTREPGESIEETATRELAEEVGGALTGPLAWVGAFRVDHSKVGRHRPHLPFPISYWAYLAADVELLDSVGRPGAGEQVVSVRTLPPSAAIAFLADFDDGPVTDVVRLAHAMGLTGQHGEIGRNGVVT